MGVMLYRMLQGSKPFTTREELVAGAVTFDKPISKGVLIVQHIEYIGYDSTHIYGTDIFHVTYVYY